MATKYIDDEINRQLERLGATGGEAPISAWMDDEREGCVYVTDHVASSGVYPADRVLAALRSLPDDAGWQAAWDAIGTAGRPDHATE